MPVTNPSIEIIIADDSDRLRQRLKTLLSTEDMLHVVAEAASAPAAVELVDTHHPDLAILDIQMPGNGIKALKEVKRRWPDVKVIMFSNHADSFFRRTSLKAGADAFLDKSLEFVKVPATIRRLVGIA